MLTSPRKPLCAGSGGFLCFKLTYESLEGYANLLGRKLEVSLAASRSVTVASRWIFFVCFYCTLPIETAACHGCNLPIIIVALIRGC